MKTNDKFTPGPWHGMTCEGYPGEFLLWTGNSALENDRVLLPQTRANLRLIAAAPDLLAALNQLDAWFSSGVTVDGRYPELAHSWVRGAIAKAQS